MTRRALVTVAGGGLGVVICRRLLEDGLAVVATDVTEEVPLALASMAHEIRYAGADLAAPASIASVAERVSHDGDIHVLVNNAGRHEFRPEGGKFDSTETTLEQWEQTLAINLTSAFELTKAAVPGMQRHGWGRIVHGDIAGRADRRAGGIARLRGVEGRVGGVLTDPRSRGRDVRNHVELRRPRRSRVDANVGPAYGRGQAEAARLGSPVQARHPRGDRSRRQLSRI